MLREKAEQVIVLWKQIYSEVMREANDTNPEKQDGQKSDKRWHSLLRILQHQCEKTQEFLDYSLDEAIALTGSKIGYIYYYHDQRREFVLNSWSKDVMNECRIVNPQTCYALDNTGIWGEAVRQGKPIIVNNYQSPNPLKKGYPEGHARLLKYMTIPVFSDGRIVAVVGVANKETDYDSTDVLQVQLLMEAVWKVLQQRRAEESERQSRVALQERVKELKCISLIGEDMQMDLPLEDFCNRIAGHLKNAMENPEQVTPVIEIEGMNFSAGRMKGLTENYLESEILTGGREFGNIRIYASPDKSFYLPEEQNLVDQVARLTGLWYSKRQAELQLKQNQEDLYITLQSIGDGFIATDINGRVIRMNPVAERMTGSSFSEAFEKPVEELFSLVNAHSRKIIDNPVTMVLQSGEAMGLANHTVLISKKGRELHVADSAAPIRDNEGHIRGVVFIFSDVTEKYLVEEKLRKSEEKYRVLAENTETILWEFDIETDRWTYVAPQVERILGYEPSEWSGLQFWADHLHPDDRDWAQKYCTECTKKGKDHIFEYRFRKKDGSYAWLLDEVKVGMNDDKPVRMWGSFRDITRRKTADNALRDSEIRYRTIFETSPDAIIINNTSGEIVDVNDSFTRLTGYTRDEILGKSSLDVGLWTETGERDKFIESLEKTGYTRAREVSFRSNDGTLKTGLISARMVNINNEPLVFTFARDISLSKRLKVFRKIQYKIADAVLTSENIYYLFKRVREELGNVFDTSNFIIAFYDKESGMLTSSYNTGETKPYKWPAENSLAGKVIKENRPLIIGREGIGKLAESGRINPCCSEAEQWMGVPIREGTTVKGIIIVKSYDDPDAYNDHNIELLELVANQLSVYIERNSNLETTLKLSRAIEQSPVSIMITDTNSRIEYVNPKFLEITGYDYREVIGQNPRILQSGRHDRKFYKELYDTVLSGKNFYGEMLNKKKSGELYWEKAVISPVFDKKGDIINYIGIKEDITDIKRLIKELLVAKERAEESDRLKSAFLANMSHEIRTPMNSIVGFSGLLKKNKLTEGKKDKFIEIINSNAEHLLGLIEGIIDLSKIESGNVEISSETVDIEELFGELEERFSPLKPQLDMRFDNGAVKKFLGDRVKLDQILSNLIGNAVKFTVRGFIKCSVTREGDMLVFKVHDSGTGIRKKDQKKIFDRFVQGEHSIWMSRSGTGLGLSLVRAYLDKMGGKIWLDSIWQEGSIFWFSIPFSEVEDINAGEQGSDQEGLMASGRKINMLVAEDDMPGFFLIEEIFKGTGAKIVHAVNGREAVDLAGQFEFDIILMDIKMPVMNGIEATRIIKAINPRTPVIAVSAHAFISEQKKALQAGCDQYITKPLQSKELLETVRQLLESPAKGH